MSGAVADTNLCYINSQLDVRVRLVGFEQIEYESSGTLETDLDLLQDLNDGFMDEVAEFREQFGADVVSLLASHGNKGGLANTMNTPSLGFADSAFNVNLWDQIGAPSYTLAHEIGHNMGCLHNREDVSVEDARSAEEYDFYEFGYGKRWTTNEEQAHRVAFEAMKNALQEKLDAKAEEIKTLDAKIDALQLHQTQLTAALEQTPRDSRRMDANDVNSEQVSQMREIVELVCREPFCPRSVPLPLAC